MTEQNKANWETRNFHDFWAEIAPKDHLVQVYESEQVFLNTLEGFVASGLTTGDTVIVIASQDHVMAIDARLRLQPIDVDGLVQAGKYFPLDARDMLEKFVIAGWPDEKLFFETVSSLFAKARKSGSKIRAFGEMVAILWEQGNYAATVHLEHLWNKFCARQAFCLFCAYPQSGFTQDAGESVAHICHAHSKMIAGVSQSQTEVFYKTVEKQVG
ncbi:MAG TPA: MEDS domain-containing protein [Chryseolinea sp.]|nr:MEDS domain-containing protein [Chryseolinea sp.]